MHRALSLAFCCLLSLAATGGEFATFEGRFYDTARDRAIPYLIYSPAPLEGTCPVVIISHGFGGSRHNNEHLGKYLAANGFVAIHVQHAGSDQELFRRGQSRQTAEARARASAADPRNAVDRFLDIPVVVRELAELNAQDEHLRGHLDLDALGMAGHSYGALSTLVAAGARVGDGYRSFRVPELRAGVLLSPGPPDHRYDAARVYADVTIPLFHMTGTRDASFGQFRSVTPADRTRPYEFLNIPDQYLLVLNKADHATFSSERIGTRREKKIDKQHMAAVLSGALVFFRAYLQHDRKARAWLRSEYARSLSKTDRFEFK